MRKFILAIIGLALSLSLFAQNQNEFKIYGKIKAANGPAEGVTIKVTQRGYKFLEVQTDANGAYDIYLPYGKNYVISYIMDGFQTLTFDALLELPINAPQCCYRPMEISYHLFNPDEKYKKLFNKTFHVIAYEKQFKGFNYDLDVDYMIQQRIVNTELFEQQLEMAKNGAETHKDSIKAEKRYMAMINQGTIYYEKSQFYAARKFFTEATKLKPNRLYSYYKLEDIKTEIERFETKAELLGINLDSIINAELAKAEEVEEGPKTYPAYVPLTDQQVEEIFRAELQKQVYASSSNVAEGNRTMRLMDEFFSEEAKKNTAIAKTEKKKEKKQKVEEQPVVAQVEKKPEAPAEPIDLSQKPVAKPKTVVKQEPVKKVVDFATYQDSLMHKYPNERTIEITQDEHKKTTRVFMNDGKRVEIYTMVEHSWGATYYFLEEYPTGTTSIGYAAFVNKTKLTDLNNIQPTQPANNQ